MKTKRNLIQLCLLGAVLVLPTVMNAQATFAPATNYTVGILPYSVAAADVNGDGNVDLISANESSGTLTILTNNGSGSYGSNTTLHTSPGPVSVVVADVNGDGTADLICACSVAGSVMVWTNSGNGGFANSGYYFMGGNSYPHMVMAVDVNGDGKVDFISANNNSLAVFTNAGNGNFAAASSPGVGSPSVSVAAADVNGDGNIDLIEANAYSLRVLTNGGNGTFFLCSTSALPMNWPGRITTVDLNGNGKVSVVVPDYDSGSGKTLVVLTNDGSGNFGSNATYTVGNGPIYVIAADINGDGKEDLITANGAASGTLTILTNNGGGFGFNCTLNAGSLSLGVVQAADVNGDGKLDLIASISSGTISVLLNTSIFPPPASTPTVNINPSGNEMRVSWPSASAGWSLQQNPDLTPTHWNPSGYSGYDISDNGTNKSLTIPSPSGNLFFRLFHP
jgi:hypothetical protein